MCKVLACATISMIFLYLILPDMASVRAAVTLLMKGLYDGGVKCPVNQMSRSRISTRLLIFKNTTSKWEELKQLSELPRNNTIHLLMHSWKENATMNIYSLMAKAYKIAGTSTVLMLDWGDYANVPKYYDAICSIMRISQDLAEKICALKNFNIVELQMIHLVGFALGAHLAGFTGKEIKRRCGIVGRITGLDPSGPLFQGFKKSKHLHKDDAMFVDVIHTNILQFGYFGNMGHVDFYPNGGYFQPGCEKIINDVKIKGASEKEKYATCNHRRSIEFFYESILNNTFRGVPCLRCDIGINIEIRSSQDYAYMGESCRHPQKHRSYIVTTAENSPYGLGPTEPLS